MEAAIRTEKLSKTFGSTEALVDLDLEVPTGEVLGYLGPNGAGKATTIRLLLGLIRATRGRAEVFGVDTPGPRGVFPRRCAGTDVREVSDVACWGTSGHMEVQSRDWGGGLDLDLEMPALPSMLSDVRCAMGELRLPAPVLDDARLLVSELVANSIKHAGLRPDDRIHVKAEIARGRLRVDVLDGGRFGGAPSAGGIRPTPGSGSGWGLYLVETLAARWGHGPGRYWFELQLDRRVNRHDPRRP